MASNGSGGFELGTIIFCIIMWNICISDNDDNLNKAEIEVEVKNQSTVEKIQESASKITQEAKQAIRIITTDIKESVNDIKDNDIKDNDTNDRETIIEEPNNNEIPEPDIKKDSMKKIDGHTKKSTHKKL